MKKTLIISIAMVIAILLIAVVVFYITKNNSSQNVQTENKAPVQTSNQVFLPVLPGTEKVKIDTQNINQSVQENITKAQASSQETMDTKFQDTKSKPLSLDQFKSATSITIKPEIYSNLSQTDFSVFTCTKQLSTAESKGLIMRFKPGTTAAYYANIYKKMSESLAGWEGTMFSDLAPFLFPEEQISQKPSFKSTKYTTENGAATIDVRFANMKSDDGLNVSIDYTVYAENVYIFNNPQCLRKALDKYEPVLEP